MDGFRGKIEPGETIDDGAVRELEEDSWLRCARCAPQVKRNTKDFEYNNVLE